MIPDQDWIIDVDSAEYVKGYQLRISFSDGTERIVDFGRFLHESLNPMIKKHLDIDTFKGFSVEHGDLFWNDYDLCFPIADLYEGRIWKGNASCPVTRTVNEETLGIVVENNQVVSVAGR